MRCEIMAATAITNYQIVAGSDPNDLARKVEKLLAEGWTLYGAPLVTVAVQGKPVFHQALVK